MRRTRDLRIAACLRAIALAGLALACALPAQAADYAGLWKVNCQDHLGLQIKPLQGGLYSVSLCRPEGCTRPGAYRPNTKIDGDPAYQVLTPTRIRIRDSEGGLRTYVRCTADPNSMPR